MVCDIATYTPHWAGGAKGGREWGMEELDGPDIITQGDFLGSAVLRFVQI